MTKAITLSALLATGLLFAAKDPNRLSGNQKVALATQSPRVHTSGKKHAKDRVTADKHTINAFVQGRK